MTLLPDIVPLSVVPGIHHAHVLIGKEAKILRPGSKSRVNRWGREGGGGVWTSDHLPTKLFKKKKKKHIAEVLFSFCKTWWTFCRLADPHVGWISPGSTERAAALFLSDGAGGSRTSSARRPALILPPLPLHPVGSALLSGHVNLQPADQHLVLCQTDVQSAAQSDVTLCTAPPPSFGTPIG